MKRVLVALMLAPVLVSALFGWPFALLVLPYAWLITAVVATPLFFLFRKHGWLNWWQVALAGLLCGLIFVGFFDSAARFDSFGIEDSLYFGGIGALIAVVFWWLGLFRNAFLPAAPSPIPYSMLVLVPLVALSVPLYRSLYITNATGRIIAVNGEAPTRQVTVRLSNGIVVESQLLRDSRPTSALMNQCWHLMNHWSTLRFKRVYSLEAPFGGGIDDC
jgi:hypothetical protein